jgi:hypothetical protein
MKKIFRSKKHWQKILFDQPTSSLSISQYCKNKNINISNFYAWRKRLSSNESTKPGFLRLNKPSFPTLRDLRIETPNGYKIELNGFDESIFQKILGMVKTI